MIDKRVKKYCKTVSVLGQKYKITFKTETEDADLTGRFGYIQHSSKEITMNDLYNNPAWARDSDIEMDFRIRETLRHEILHAFFFESGLEANSSDVSGWAKNEEMVDWFALQSPKIFKVYKELKCL